MNHLIEEFLKSQRVGVLAVEMVDGSPHGATVHFAHSVRPFVLYFETYRTTRKAQALLEKKKTRASYVIGSDESNMKTLQMDGEVQLLASSEKGAFDEIYLGKFPEKKNKAEESKFLAFKFTPTWWRFTDWTGPDGKMTLTSEKKNDE